jgi:hypothetical protein
MLLHNFLPSFLSSMRLLRICCFSALVVSVLSACLQSKTDPTVPVSATETSTGSVEPPQTASLPPQSLPPKSQPLPTLHDLIGLDRDQITALFGTPHFRRQDKPADLWQYRNKKCALDLFLYRIRDGVLYKVTHAEVRTLNGAKVTKTTCFKKLIKHHIDQMKNKNTG